MEELLLGAISNIGVPAAICFFCLFRLDRSINQLSQNIQQLSNLIQQHFS